MKNKYKLKLWILAAVTLIAMSSCLSVVKAVTGLRDPEFLSDHQITKTAKRYGLGPYENYKLDSGYFHYLMGLDTSIYSKQSIKNHWQPLQALYFDANGDLIKYYINCYAGGFFFIDWNRDGRLETFLPGDQAPLDSVLNLKQQFDLLVPLSELDSEKSVEKADYYVVVYWNKCMRRHSKRLIRMIKANIDLADSATVQLIFVNYDNAYTTMKSAWDSGG